MRSWFSPVLATLALSSALAVDDKPTGAADSVGALQPYNRTEKPDILPASGAAAQMVKQIQVPEGMKVELWASEPDLANPVSLSVDEQGRVFVAETHRLGSSVLDIRNYMFLLEDDLASRTVADRLSMMHRRFGPQFDEFSKEQDFIRVLEDRSHTGKADFNAIYGGPFSKPEDGIAAGVLARNGTVWATIIPHLWKFEGMNAEGHAEKTESISDGYGVRFNYTGHDLHGLIMGPDGKLYFSEGDRGANAVAKDGSRVSNPDAGGVFRCNPDGTELELVHGGLRNPQELAFDDYGNLFTGDNDFDYGDTERLVYVVEGGDSGWRVGYQHPPLGKERVTWKAEQIWVCFNTSQDQYDGKPHPTINIDKGVRPAAYLPPVSNIGDGPSGLLYDPGTGITPAFRHHFFLCQCKGSYARSEIHAFTVKEKGATFELGDSKPFVRYVQPPDVDIGPDGSIFFLDWGETMSKTAKGRIFRMYDPAVLADPKTKETQHLLEQGMANRGTEELVRLLGHEDRRVRMDAQFELVKRKDAKSLEAAAVSKAPLLARIHAIWGCGQLLRSKPELASALLPLLNDKESEIRVQAAKVLGEGRVAAATTQLVSHLQDAAPRVRFQAAMSLARIKAKDVVPAILTLLKDNNDQDPYIRHACIYALQNCADAAFFARDFRKEPEPVKMGVLLAMRRVQDPHIAQFLDSSLPIKIVVEAARAISDGLITSADSALANLHDLPKDTEGSPLAEALYLRITEALRRQGNVDGLAAMALNAKAPEAVRGDCFEILAEMAHPLQRDRILGIWRPLAPHDASKAPGAVRQSIETLLSRDKAADPQKESVLVAAVEAAQKLQVTGLAPHLVSILKSSDSSSKLRASALHAIGASGDTAVLSPALHAALGSTDAALRTAAVELLPRLDAKDATPLLQQSLEKGNQQEKAAALGDLGQISSASSDALLGDWLDKLAHGSVDPKLQLDLIEAAKARTASAKAAPALKTKLQAYLDALPKGKTTDGFPFLLEGGDAAAGKKVFFEFTSAQCVRCHKIKGKGSEVGPILDGIGKRGTRQYILESILFPNAKIAPGFEMTMLTTKDGQVHSGMVRKETSTELHLSQPVPNSPIEVVKKADVTQRTPGMSAMPEMFQQVLSQRQIRDLVAYLATLK